MSRDKYSNNHTIEVLNDAERLLLKTGSGPISLSAGAGDLPGNGTDSDINLTAQDSVVMTANDVEVFSTNNILIRSDTSQVVVEAHQYAKLMSNGVLRLESTGQTEMATSASFLIDVFDTFDVDAKKFSMRTSNWNEEGAGIEMDGVDPDNSTLDIACKGELNIHGEKGVDISSKKDISLETKNYCEIIAKQAIHIQAEQDPVLYNDVSVGRIILEPHANNHVLVEGDLAVNGSLSIGGLATLNNAVDWSDIQPASGIKLTTTDADGITFATPEHLAAISYAGSGDNRGCEVGGYFTQLKGKYIYIGTNYESDYTDFWDDDNYNNKWEEYHGTGVHCKKVKIGAETHIQAENDGQGGGINSGHVLTVSNSTGSSQNYGVKIQLNSEGTYVNNWAPHTARWLEFTWGRPPYGTGPGEQYVAGLIKGVILQNDGYGYGFLSSTTGPGAPNPLAHQLYANEAYNQNNPPHSGNPPQQEIPVRASVGNAQFVSGLADFGEFFEAGDLSEWPEACADRKSKEGDPAIMGLQEGMVVWVRGNKFYKNMDGDNCIPMFITNRSIVTGDGRAILTEEGLGEVLSFCGKLPIIVKGATSPGDYIIPEDNENYCYAVSSSEITFAQYKRAMGRALTGCEDKVILRDDHPFAPGQETEFSGVLCAVGLK